MTVTEHLWERKVALLKTIWRQATEIVVQVYEHFGKISRNRAKTVANPAGDHFARLSSMFQAKRKIGICTFLASSLLRGLFAHLSAHGVPAKLTRKGATSC